MRFAGDIPEGWGAQLMRTTVDYLIDGATDAATQTEPSAHTGEALTLAVSCVGRRLVMGGRVDEEAEACKRMFASALQSPLRGINRKRQKGHLMADQNSADRSDREVDQRQPTADGVGLEAQEPASAASPDPRPDWPVPDWLALVVICGLPPALVVGLMFFLANTRSS